MADPTPVTMRDNPDAKRFETEVDGRIAFAAYNRIAGGIVLAHTEVPRELEGRGIASQLFQAVVASLRAADQKVMPVCPVFALWLKKHAEAHDVVHPSYRSALGIPTD